MNSPQLFQYAILWHPNDKQKKEENLKSTILKELTTILAADEKSAFLSAGMEIPLEYKDELYQVQIAIRPF